jgi:hypothetical protein
VITKFAGNTQRPRTTDVPIVRKAASLDRRSEFVLSPEIQKMITATVTKSVSDLVDRIVALQERAKRL